MAADTGLRRPPQNLDAERGVIGAVLLDDAMLHDVASVVGPDDFYREAHGLIFRAMAAVAERGERIDAATVHDELARMGRLDEAGGGDYLGECVASVPHAAFALQHAQIVRQKAVARGLIAACEESLADCYSGRFTAEELCTRAESAVFAVTEGAGRAADPVPLAGAVSSALEAVDRRRAGEVTGVSSGFDDLDALTDGFHPGQMVVVAARPSQGKTALAMAFADHAATEAGVPTLFASLEMGLAELGGRYLSARGGVDGYRLKNAHLLSDADMRGLGLAKDASRRSRLSIADLPAANVSQLAALARRHKARWGLGLVVVDYLQLLDGQRQKGESREQEVARVSRRLKSLAKELGVPAVVLAQLNRQSESRDKHRPRLSDLRESGQIEQDADVVILLHRPEYYDANDQPGVAELLIAKNRNGATGTVRLLFEKHLTRFSALSPVDPAGGPF